MILGVRALLIAVLLVGSTGSAMCQSICAEAPDFQATAHAGSAETAQTSGTAEPDHHAGCHGAGVPSSEPLSKRSGEPCEGGCCTVLARATADPISGPGPTPTASPVPAGIALDEARIGPDLLRHLRPAARLQSPFQFRNPPLLI